MYKSLLSSGIKSHFRHLDQKLRKGKQWGGGIKIRVLEISSRVRMKVVAEDTFSSNRGMGLWGRV